MRGWGELRSQGRLGPFPAQLIDGTFKRRPPSRTYACAPPGGAHAKDGEGVNGTTQTHRTHLGILLCVISFLFVPNQAPSWIVSRHTNNRARHGQALYHPEGKCSLHYSVLFMLRFGNSTLNKNQHAYWRPLGAREKGGREEGMRNGDGRATTNPRG